MNRPPDPAGTRSRPSPRWSPNLGWGEQADKIVFAHTHQPLADVARSQDPRLRYWNTGSWIYEPDLSSRGLRPLPAQRLARYRGPDRRRGAAPRLVELLADLNPLSGA